MKFLIAIIYSYIWRYKHLIEMHLAILPKIDSSPRLPFYLAVEEWIAQNVPVDCFFAWQVAPSVICGRNQDIPAEVDLVFCQNHDIDVYRRKSGGGAVFADYSNIMFSCITNELPVADAFEIYTARVAGALRGLGLDAHASGRNDILIGDRKVAGNACLQCFGRTIVHGTMLFDTDYDMMRGALTPSKAKLESNKVKSVESRITTVREHLPDIAMDDFMNHVISNICDGTIAIPDCALKDIRTIEATYYNIDFIERGICGKQKRITGVGSIGASVQMKDGVIDSIALTGDFFSETEADTIINNLKGTPADQDSITKLLGERVVVAGMDNRKLAAIIYESAMQSDTTLNNL